MRAIITIQRRRRATKHIRFTSSHLNQTQMACTCWFQPAKNIRLWLRLIFTRWIFCYETRLPWSACNIAVRLATCNRLALTHVRYLICTDERNLRSHEPARAGIIIQCVNWLHALWNIINRQKHCIWLYNRVFTRSSKHRAGSSRPIGTPPLAQL